MVGSAVSGITSIFAGEEQAEGYEEAAGISERNMQDAIAEIRRQFDTIREDFEPYREIGGQGLEAYAALYGMGREGLLSDEQVAEARDRFKTTPGYEFRFDEGVRALDRSAASRGRLRSGAHERGLTRYGQGIAAEEFNTYANRLQSLANIGQSASASTAAAGTAAGAGIASAYMGGAELQGNFLAGAGTARASGYVGASNAFNQGWQNEMQRAQQGGTAAMSFFG